VTALAGIVLRDVLRSNLAVLAAESCPAGDGARAGGMCTGLDVHVRALPVVRTFQADIRRDGEIIERSVRAFSTAWPSTSLLKYANTPV
jgi:hypothetical protein